MAGTLLWVDELWFDSRWPFDYGDYYVAQIVFPIRPYCDKEGTPGVQIYPTRISTISPHGWRNSIAGIHPVDVDVDPVNIQKISEHKLEVILRADVSTGENAAEHISNAAYGPIFDAAISMGGNAARQYLQHNLPPLIWTEFSKYLKSSIPIATAIALFREDWSDESVLATLKVVIDIDCSCIVYEPGFFEWSPKWEVNEKTRHKSSDRNYVWKTVKALEMNGW